MNEELTVTNHFSEPRLLTSQAFIAGFCSLEEKGMSLTSPWTVHHHHIWVNWKVFFFYGGGRGAGYESYWTQTVQPLYLSRQYIQGAIFKNILLFPGPWKFFVEHPGTKGSSGIAARGTTGVSRVSASGNWNNLTCQLRLKPNFSGEVWQLVCYISSLLFFTRSNHRINSAIYSRAKWLNSRQIPPLSFHILRPQRFS